LLGKQILLPPHKPSQNKHLGLDFNQLKAFFEGIKNGVGHTAETFQMNMLRYSNNLAGCPTLTL
jgi:hypothetical protein